MLSGFKGLGFATVYGFGWSKVQGLGPKPQNRIFDLGLCVSVASLDPRVS